VAVVVPTYNMAWCLRRAVVSGPSQPTVSHVIIVDDGSTDETPALLERLSLEDSRVTSIRLLRNEGTPPRGVARLAARRRRLGAVAG
jgi:glycosyltransferase involved in cell wall biosynthesis